LFKGKTVVLFALPVAFKPTCSSMHLPRFNELAGVFKANGIDSLICLAVNDPFVMQTWQAPQHAENIDFIPDGNGEFTEGMASPAPASVACPANCWLPPPKLRTRQAMHPPLVCKCLCSGWTERP